MTAGDLAFVVIVGGGFLAMLGVFVALAQLARVGRALQQLTDWLERS